MKKRHLITMPYVIISISHAKSNPELGNLCMIRRYIIIMVLFEGHQGQNSTYIQRRQFGYTGARLR
jgi:hypothetical protein